MPPYVQATAASNTPVKLLQPGVIGYAFGSFNDKFPTTVMGVTNVALTGNVAVVSVKVREGLIPSVGSLITITGTTTAGGAFNVTNVAIATVSIDAVLGTGTISFALVHADVGSAQDTGTATVPVPEVGDALVVGASQQFAVQYEAGMNDNAKTIKWSTFYPSAPSGVTMQLQAADVDIDAQYFTIDSSNTTAGEIRTLNLRNYRFLRANCSAVSGGSSPTAVVRIGI